jgi:hypothetical protein
MLETGTFELTNAEGNVTIHHLEKIPPFQILETLLGDKKEGSQLGTIKRLLGSAVYDGVSKSVSATILSDHELKSEPADLFSLSQLYILLLTRLIEDR